MARVKRHSNNNRTCLIIMKKKSLMETNPYLKAMSSDPELLMAVFRLSVDSSTALEGVRTKYPRLSKKHKAKIRKIRGDMSKIIATEK